MIDNWDRHLWWWVSLVVSLGLMEAYRRLVRETCDETRDVARRIRERGTCVFLCTCLVMSWDAWIPAYVLGWTFWYQIGLVTVHTGVMFWNECMFDGHCQWVFLQVQGYVWLLKYFRIRKEPTDEVIDVVYRCIARMNPFEAFWTNYMGLLMQYEQIKARWRTTQIRINNVQEGLRPADVATTGPLNLHDAEEMYLGMHATLYTFLFQICSVWPVRLLLLLIYLFGRELYLLYVASQVQTVNADFWSMVQERQRLLQLQL